jgi:hypothetical protein
MTGLTELRHPQRNRFLDGLAGRFPLVLRGSNSSRPAPCQSSHPSSRW